MKLEFLPAMAFVAREEVAATFFVVDNEVRRLPVGAGDRVVKKNVRLSPEVLPVVRVDAQGLVVLGQVERTKDRFVMEDEEIIIEFVVVDQLDFDVALGMGKRTKYPIVAFVYFVWVVRAEFGFVLFLTVLSTIKRKMLGGLSCEINHTNCSTRLWLIVHSSP